jgi:cytochrome c oxidase subunit 2
MTAFLALLVSVFLTFPALANESAVWHWGGFPTPITSVGWHITDLYNLIFVITAVIALVVALPIAIIIFNYRRSRMGNKAATFSHNLTLELLWTIIPALICAVIAWQSFSAMRYILTTPEGGMTVEVIAYQFGFDFDYPDFQISAPEATTPHPVLSIPGRERLVKDMVVPVDSIVKLHITARDVLHAFFAPALGIKMDAVPGRINHKWFRAEKEGDYIGQCAELCGSAHGEMFFNVKVVNKEAFKAWVNQQRTEKGLEPVLESKFAEVLDGIKPVVVETPAPETEAAVPVETSPTVPLAVSGSLEISPSAIPFK